jgi:hypothetical protein
VLIAYSPTEVQVRQQTLRADAAFLPISIARFGHDVTTSTNTNDLANKWALGLLPLRLGGKDHSS